MARTWILKQRPAGDSTAELFELEDRTQELLDEGQVRVRNLWASVDPYMRGLLNGQGGYVSALDLNTPMSGGAAGVVIESRAPHLPVGTTIIHNEGWRLESVVAADKCMTVDPAEGIALEHYLGSFGMPGMTAYFGLLAAGAAQAGETLFVSSAAGAVGSTVVQIAKASGLRVIGSAGGPEKCEAVAKLGADAVLDYQCGDLSKRLGEMAPDGIDIYFDNVGADHLAAAIDHARLHMRIVLCGMISSYGNDAQLSIRDPMRFVAKRIRLQGLFAPDYFAERSRFLADMHRWFRQGALKCPVKIYHGIEAMPEAFRSLYRGGAVGKVLVQLGE